MARISLKRFAEGMEIDPGRNAGKYWVRGGLAYWDRFAVSGADMATFEPLGRVWAKDAKRVYCQGSQVRGADPATFVVPNALFAKDRRGVYCRNGACKGCDPATFEVLDRGTAASLPDMEDDACGYARDRRNVYYHESGEGLARLVRGADRDTFRVLKHGYATDGKAVFAYGRRVEKADSASFRVLGRFYARDRARAYYRQYEVAGADPATFRVLADDRAEDAQHTYWQSRVEKIKTGKAAKTRRRP